MLLEGGGNVVEPPEGWTFETDASIPAPDPEPSPTSEWHPSRFVGSHRAPPGEVSVNPSQVGITAEWANVTKVGMQMSGDARRDRMWKNLRRLMAFLRKPFSSGAEARRIDQERARFWADVHEGEREAEAKSGP